ncbi:probable serine/threonine-protein kinase ndrD isoform X2 [Apis mellifera]|uniref:Probable serine/threonine-protein kinase ndrD isoform X2 n=1 Tax=Apis mellifera TaxID=7460 RepID=A0A7M7GYQ4_APIME|nr:probable serine/threonine-protein kinase ndrD isoform X2 [Apis mellifera]|eukprot:XP_006568656.1 probable serine/threonine-protein kinase ndrD isoform X2 [Apis mellifera]
MEGHSYVSCIKINGIPILPPMITKDIKRELSNYKESAINIEKKLIISRINKQCNSNTYKVQKELKDIKYNHSSRENLIPFEYDNFNENIVTDISDVPIETFKSSNENLEKTLEYDKDLNLRCKSENQINLVPSTVSRSESITSSNDSNTTTLIKSTTTETVSEIWKPQVPKTLNIIPLTLNNTNLKENEFQENNLDNLGDTPKLVRQGSYVLDTPSPILLAHMQMELTSSTCVPSSEYVPTSCANVNRRKEWNVAQTKVEWEYETKNKESVPIANFYSNIDHKMCKSVSLQTKPECSLATYSSTRSADCIQTMLAKEYIDKSDIQINQDKKHSIDNNNEMRKKLQTWNKCNSSCTFNSACKIGGSLENLTEQNNISTSNNFMKKLSRNTDIKNSISRLKSTIASDKLLTVYKKVQEMHKKQMAELMFRQHREQTLLQKEFEKQQLLLLIEIKKSFPEVSVPLLSENILSPAFNQIISNDNNDNKVFENNNDNMQNVKKVKNNLEDKIEYSQDHNMKMVSCPLNYIYPEMNYDNTPCSTKYSCIVQSSETELSNINNSIKKMKEKDVEIQSNDIKNHKEKLLEETEDSKRSNIKAANVINAYTRGYLVRRMMRTERVIALKNTYKEALHCMLKLHVDAPLNRSEFNFLHRLQLQCDAASMNIVELFAQNPQKRMQVIAQDREIKQTRVERPTSARSYSFATQRTLARKKLKEMEEYQPTSFVRSCLSRSRCQTWTSDIKERLISSNILYQSIKRSTSAGTVRKPWR